MLTRESLIQHLLSMKNGTNKTTPQQAYYEYAAAFYRDLIPEWKLGQGLREAMQNQKDAKNGRD